MINLANVVIVTVALLAHYPLPRGNRTSFCVVVKVRVEKEYKASDSLNLTKVHFKKQQLLKWFSKLKLLSTRSPGALAGMLDLFDVASVK